MDGRNINKLDGLTERQLETVAMSWEIKEGLSGSGQALWIACGINAAGRYASMERVTSEAEAQAWIDSSDVS